MSAGDGWDRRQSGADPNCHRQIEYALSVTHMDFGERQASSIMALFGSYPAVSRACLRVFTRLRTIAVAAPLAGRRLELLVDAGCGAEVET